MKTKELVTIFMLSGIAMFFASCTESAIAVDDVLLAADETKSTELALSPGDSCDFTAMLSADEIAGLMEMREEEKLARDVYLSFYETHGQIIFKNIAKSEDAHTRAVLHLINGFGLTDPAMQNPGEFNNDLFTTLFNDLSEKGNANLTEALKVGAFIEEYDIADLQELLEKTENVTIKRVYGNLLRGSKNHIRAFSNLLKSMGETYTPTVISEEEYRLILNESAGTANTVSDSVNGVCNGTVTNN